ncbi:hypothetical protein HDU67_005045, partial [Dinochytrium kinnereticum]
MESPPSRVSRVSAVGAGAWEERGWEDAISSYGLTLEEDREVPLSGQISEPREWSDMRTDGWEFGSYTLAKHRPLTRHLRRRGVLLRSEKVSSILSVSHQVDSGKLLSMALQLKNEGVVNRPLDMDLLQSCVVTAGFGPCGWEAPVVDVRTMYKPVSRKIKPALAPLEDGVAPQPWEGPPSEDRPPKTLTEDQLDTLCADAHWLQPEEMQELRSMLKEEAESLSFELKDRDGSDRIS